jgi:hypothetical protein
MGKWVHQLSSGDQVVGPKNLQHKGVLQDRDFANANDPSMAKGDSPERLCIIVDGRLIMLFASRRACQTSHDQSWRFVKNHGL